MSKVLVTGGSGFVAGHCIQQLLAAGHEVCTTVRKLSREAEVRQAVGHDGPELSFVAADLMADAGWADAVRGCDFVLHVASPFITTEPEHEDELIVPAREGTLRVLRAARDAGVKRVVVTSSFAAIGYGQAPRDTPFDERDWSDPDAKVSAYVKSKTLAERAAWDFIAREGGALELAVVNPVAVFGPILSADVAASIDLLKQLLKGALPALPKIMTGVVDVRDVADLHLRAMLDPAAKGERFLAVSGDFMPFAEVAATLKKALGERAKRVPTRTLPSWLVRLVVRFDRKRRGVLGELGKSKNATSAKAQRMLGWTPRSREEAIVSAAESLYRFDQIKH